MKHVVFVGDSHIAALKRGSQEMDLRDDVRLHFIPFGPGTMAPSRFWEASADGREIRITAEEWREVIFPLSLPDMQEGDEIVYVVSLPCNTSRFLRDYDWTRFVPWKAKDDHEQIPLSDAVMAHLIEGDSGQAVDFVAALSALDAPVYVLQAPRYFLHAKRVKNMKPGLAGMLTELYLTHVQRRLEDNAIPLIRQPAETVGEAGQTRDDFRHERPDDQHHGGVEFGKLMCRTVLDAVL